MAGTLLAAHIAGYVTLLLATMPLTHALVFAALHQALFGLQLGMAFAPNHKGMDMPDPDGEKWGHLRRQVLTFRNVRGSFLPDWFLGGLDYQEVPEAVGLSAYRIVQEALANVVRHAPGARTQVSLSVSERDPGAGARLIVLVVNGPSLEPSAAPLEVGGTGHGLVGMRERVRIIGGSLDVGPLPDGGFRVAALLPLTGKDFT